MCNIISQVFTCCGHKQFQNIYQCDFYTSTMIASSCSSFPRVLPDILPPRQQEEYPLRHHQTSKHEGKEGKDLAAIAGMMPAGSAATKTGTRRPVLQNYSCSSSSSSESSPPASEAETQTGRPCPNLRRPSRPVGGFCGNCIRRRRLLRLHGGSGGSCLSVGGRLGLGDLPNLPRVVLDLPSYGAGSAAAAFCSVSVIDEDREGEVEVGGATVICEEGAEGATVRRKERERERGMGSVYSTTGSSGHASSGSSATLYMGASSAAVAGTVGGVGGGQAVLHGQGIGIAI
ncbi:hypothetical protein V8F06_004142 [Rhypophila decipiens]